MIGEPVELSNGLVLTINSVEDGEADLTDWDEFLHSAVKISFDVENTTDKKVKLSAHDFTLYDAERIKTKHDSKDYFSEQIDAGMKAEGVIYYDVKNVGEMTLMVDDATFIINIE